MTKLFVRQRAAQYRDQLERNLRGELLDEEFRPLRLQNGWYIQRFAPMLRVAVPYGEISSAQLKVLATIARDFDHKTAHRLDTANPGLSDLASLPEGVGHFTTRQNVQFNWIPLEKSADVMDLLATVNMHGIQTSGNCIRNITTDALAGIAVDEVADPRPFAEILRQWSTLHPEFAFLPRKFKVAITGAQDDRAAIAWHDVGLKLVRKTPTLPAAQGSLPPEGAQTSLGRPSAGLDQGDLGFTVLVGGGMGRTPVIGTVIREFLPWNQILNYLQALVRVYNRFGRRDNMYKARIKILVKAEGQRFIDEVEAEYQAVMQEDGAPQTITQAELDRVSASFVPPSFEPPSLTDRPATQPAPRVDAAYIRWLARNVAPHQNPQLRAVTLSFKRPGFAPGDATADQLDACSTLAERFSDGEARVTHEQNLLLPWVHVDDLPALFDAASSLGLARSHHNLLTDMIACPGGDFCALANARSLPLASAITARYQDLDELDDLGDIDLHISGCINSCGHHHSGHIGILGVDKDGQEWYQITLGGSDGTLASGTPQAGKVIGPSFAASEVVDAIEAVLSTYTELRMSDESGKAHERFVQTVRRVGLEPFKAAANAIRHATARQEAAEHVAATPATFTSVQSGR